MYHITIDSVYMYTYVPPNVFQCIQQYNIMLQAMLGDSKSTELLMCLTMRMHWFLTLR